MELEIKVTIKTKNKVISLTSDEAKELYNKLHEVYGNGNNIHWPQVIPNLTPPIVTYDTATPTFPPTETITCGTAEGDAPKTTLTARSKKDITIDIT